MNRPQALSREDCYKGRFIKFQNIIWRDAQGNERRWEVVERIIGADAVMIIPWLQPSNRLVLVRQYRPPVNGYIVEFPAGLIDPDEDAPQAARRELREEAGFGGEVAGIIPPTYNTPGLSGETVFQVVMTIPDGQTPQPQPDDGEHIELLLLPAEEIDGFLAREIAAGTQFDSKVMAYLLGISSARRMGAASWPETLPGLRRC